MDIGFLARITYDYYFLVNRGYPSDHVLSLLRARYGLPKRLTTLIKRCILSKDTARTLKAINIQDPSSVRGRILVVDAFNQLTTLYAALSGEKVYICTDGFVRDDLLAGPKYVITYWKPLTDYLAMALQRLAPIRAILVFDSQPSHSGEIAARMSKILRQKGLPVEHRVSKHTDTDIIKLSGDSIVATSDTVILRRTKRAFDLADYTIRLSGLQRAITNIPLLLEKEHTTWAERGGPVA